MLIAYDLESTRIEAGTPTPLYITAFGESMRVSMPITSPEQFLQILETYFLIPEFHQARFVAWNGNNFDAYLIVQALLLSDKWEIYPFMTASKALRGLCVKSINKIKIGKSRKKLRVQFLDGIAMTGIIGKTLKEFLKTFAPAYPKLDFDAANVVFDVNNSAHIRYAERDSEGLYHAMMRVQAIIGDLTGKELKPTIANLAINYFMDNLPDLTQVKIPSQAIYAVLHGELKRGGYCWASREYTGPVWKYDINQAYAAAMRSENLPSGNCIELAEYRVGIAAIYNVIIHRKPFSLIPFYYKKDRQGFFTIGKQCKTWITGIEYAHLLRDGWTIEPLEGYGWSDTFNFSEIVTRLEALRGTDPEGPNGPLGLMVKAIGNNAYGKTLETLNDTELMIAKECPEGWNLFDPFDELAVNIYSRIRPSFMKRYHLPQIGVFITAHVRCKVRDASLLAPEHFLYADTDCVVFSKPVELDIDKTRYGAWKVEAEGVEYIIVGKKIYYGEDGATKAKGLRTKELDKETYQNWLLGALPQQSQVQRQNLLKFLNGRDMFKTQIRTGTNTGKSEVYRRENGVFTPT